MFQKKNLIFVGHFYKRDLRTEEVYSIGRTMCANTHDRHRNKASCMFAERPRPGWRNCHTLCSCNDAVDIASLDCESRKRLAALCALDWMW